MPPSRSWWRSSPRSFHRPFGTRRSSSTSGGTSPGTRRSVTPATGSRSRWRPRSQRRRSGSFWIGMSHSDPFHAFEDEWAEAVERRNVAQAAGLLSSDFALSSAGGVAEQMPREQWLETLPRIETRSLQAHVVETREYGD